MQSHETTGKCNECCNRYTINNKVKKHEFRAIKKAYKNFIHHYGWSIRDYFSMSWTMRGVVTFTSD